MNTLTPDDLAALVDRFETFRATRAARLARLVADPETDNEDEREALSDEEDELCALIGRGEPTRIGGTLYRVCPSVQGVRLLEVQEGRRWVPA